MILLLDDHHKLYTMRLRVKLPSITLVCAVVLHRELYIL